MQCALCVGDLTLPLPPTPFSAQMPFGFSLHENVCVHSLQSKPQLNGKLGMVTGFSDSRVSVQIEGEPAPISLKPDNLEESGLPVGVRHFIYPTAAPSAEASTAAATAPSTAPAAAPAARPASHKRKGKEKVRAADDDDDLVIDDVVPAGERKKKKKKKRLRKEEEQVHETASEGEELERAPEHELPPVSPHCSRCPDQKMDLRYAKSGRPFYICSQCEEFRFSGDERLERQLPSGPPCRCDHPSRPIRLKMSREPAWVCAKAASDNPCDFEVAIEEGSAT